MRLVVQTAAAIAAIMAAVSGSAHADLVVSGPVSNAGTYSTAALSTLATSSDTVASGGDTGISLWGPLAGASASSPTSPVYGGITTSTPAGYNGKNAILHDYLLATSASGAQSVFSLGELDPSFGGTAPTPAFIAYQATGGALLPSPTSSSPAHPAATSATSPACNCCPSRHFHPAPAARQPACNCPAT